jgi:succinate dehydrogenase/fumarate reductase flavoprotein subunit
MALISPALSGQWAACLIFGRPRLEPVQLLEGFIFGCYAGAAACEHSGSRRHFKTTDPVADHQEAENFNYKYRVEDNSSSAWHPDAVKYFKEKGLAF